MSLLSRLPISLSANDSYHIMRDANGTPVGMIIYSSEAQDLVKRINEHDDLVAMLRDMTDLAEEACDMREESLEPEDHETLPDLRAKVEKARELIAKVTS